MGLFDSIGNVFEDAVKVIAKETVSVATDVGTSATRIVTDTAIDIADIATGFQFSDDMGAAKKAMSDAGVLSAADAIEKNHYGFLKDMENEARTKNSEITRLFKEGQRIEIEMNNRASVLDNMLVNVKDLIQIGDEINEHLERASKIPGWEKWAQILDISPTPVNDIGKYTTDWNEVGKRIIISRMSLDATSSISALASVGLFAKASKLTKLSKISKASKFLKVAKLAGRTSTVLAIASIGLDIGLSIAELEGKQDKLEKYLKELNDGIAESNQDLTDLRREIREINLRINELLNSVEPKQQEESWDNWVEDKAEELKQLRSRIVSVEGIHDKAIKVAQNTKSLPYNVRVRMIVAIDPSIDENEAKEIINLAKKEPISEFKAKPVLIDPIRITDKYIWLPEEYKLPLVFNCNFVCNANSDLFIPCFSQTKAEWGSENCDALSWFFSPHRHDFTFRTKLFKEFPTVERHIPGFNAEVGKRYQMKCEISNNTATYWIDGHKYATASYAPGTIPTSGYIGFAVYGMLDVVIDSITTTSI
ncbi:MAG: hypothetical protein KI793_28655 [Rivularia sp. (in: Bacteria)]|nr:hypothetical protein [Rivularia sp. MS3]